MVKRRPAPAVLNFGVGCDESGGVFFFTGVYTANEGLRIRV